MKKSPLINYLIPIDMEQYMSYYGAHFNKQLYEFAVSKMRKKDKSDTTEKTKSVAPMTMDELKAMLAKYKIEIDANCMYDALYLACMVKSDFWGSSIEDEEHMALYIKDVIFDVDGYDGIVFMRFLADCSAKGEVIFWAMMI